MSTRRITQSLASVLRAWLIVGLIAGIALIVQPPRAAQAQSPDDGFNPGANNDVTALAVQA